MGPAHGRMPMPVTARAQPAHWLAGVGPARPGPGGLVYQQRARAASGAPARSRSGVGGWGLRAPGLPRMGLPGPPATAGGRAPVLRTRIQATLGSVSGGRALGGGRYPAGTRGIRRHPQSNERWEARTPGRGRRNERECRG